MPSCFAARALLPVLQGTRNQWEGAQNLGLNFNIEWLRRFELPFQETEHLRNPLNEDKPVKISRDGQELPPDIGEALVQLFEEGADRTGVPRPGKHLSCIPYMNFCTACLVSMPN